MRLALLLVAALALAGCAEPPAPAETLSSSSTAPAGSPPPAGNVTLSGPTVPRWAVGQWWTWRVETASAPAALEATTAVVAADADSYEVGSADPEEAAQVYPFHLVALGRVDAASLAWQAHGAPVQFLRFPPTDGDRFTADFWSAAAADVAVRAAQVQGPDGPEPGFRATATYAGAPDRVFAEADWSPRLGQFVRLASHFGGAEPFATATLVAAGQGAGGAKPFEATELVRWSSSLGDPAGLQPRTFTVPADAQMVLLACFLGGAPGHFQATMALSDGQPTRCQTADPAGARLEYSAQTRPAVAGGGEIAAAPAGQAGVTVEVFAVKTT